MRLHDDEVPIDPGLARRLLRTQLPALADLDVRPVRRQGTDNVVLRLGDELSLRLPRTSSAVAGLEVELAWLPRLAGQLPLSVPEPLERGEPGEGYPFPWAVCRWVEGDPPHPEELDQDLAVRDLGTFIVALHALETAGGPMATPETNRGGSLARYDQVTRAALDRIVALMADGRIDAGLFDPDLALETWSVAVSAPAWSHAPVWLHRDLHCDNLLAVDGRLRGVLDFGGLVIGDPAGDLLGAWHVLTARHRPALRERLAADEATWARARGWALSQGLQALPYYLDTHPEMVRMAERAITESLADAEGQPGP